jgi:hypothetical protein
MTWASHVAIIGEIRNPYTYLEIERENTSSLMT